MTTSRVENIVGKGKDFVSVFFPFLRCLQGFFFKRVIKIKDCGKELTSAYPFLLS